jgi:hypothetical protein
MADATILDDPTTLSFEPFWSWLAAHPNCILRAGTPEAVIYDDDDLHWHFGSEGDSTVIVQVLRGKRLVGEILVEPEQVSYVQGVAGEEEGEYVFELIAENENDQVASWFFVLSHGYEVEATTVHGRVH